MITGGARDDRQGEVEASEKRSFDEIASPPTDELEEVLQRMQQRVNVEQERLESLKVTQERSVDEIACPSDELDQVLQRVLQRVNDEKAAQNGDESPKNVIENIQEPDFFTGRAQLEQVEEVQVSQEMSFEEIVLPSEELEEVLQRIRERVND